MNLQFFRCILLFLFGIAVFGNPARADEHGDLKLFFLQNPVGQEHYDLTSSPHELVLKASFGYSERESTVHLDATLRMKADATPEEFVADGKSYRPFSVHAKFLADAVGKSAAVEEGGASRQVPLPNRYFAISGYAPLSVQMMLLRYWTRHGKPPRLAQFPAGAGVADILIDVAGQDNIEANGRTVHLTRYSVRNVVWGRESVWLDDSEQIAAATTYAGGLPLEAIRPEYAGALQQLIHAAVTDRLNEAAELKRSIRPIAEYAFAISGVHLIDGTGHGPIADATVLVRDGRVVAAGPAREVSIPVGVRVINAPGPTLLPGLWDMHAHFAQTDWGPAYLAAGVTSARDCGNEFEFITRERDAISEGRVLGPRLLLAGLVDGSGPKSFGTTWADTPEQARPVVDRYKAAGFAQMKIYDWIRLGVLRAITVEAHRQGMTVTGHIPRGLSAMQAVEAGMDQINHIGSVFQAIAGQAAGPLDLNSSTATEAIQFFREHDTVIDPTLSWNELLGRPMNFDIASFEPGFAKAPYVFYRLWPAQTKAFLRIVCTGSWSCMWKRISPMDVIRLATDGAARAMGVDKELGTVEAGKRADLILVDGNPLSDFSALRRVTRVISNGRMYDSSELWRGVDFQP